MVSNNRKVVVNAFSISMLQYPAEAVVRFRRLSIEEVRELLQGNNVENYIRHQGTIQALQSAGIQLGAPNNVYIYRPGDVIIMIVLASPQRGQEVTAPRLEDLMFYLVSVE